MTLNSVDDCLEDTTLHTAAYKFQSERGAYIHPPAPAPLPPPPQACYFVFELYLHEGHLPENEDFMLIIVPIKVRIDH